MDLAPLFEAASWGQGCPLVLLLGAAKAESGLNSHAEHLGVWPDVSFGLAQISVAYSYYGDGTDSPANIASVRDYVFAHPDVDLAEMAKRLTADLSGARDGGADPASSGVDLSPVGGDAFLMACVRYNAGHYPPAGDSYWTAYAANVAGYVAGLAWARGVVV